MVGGGLEPDSSSSVSMALVVDTPRLEMVDVLILDLVDFDFLDPSWLNLCCLLVLDDPLTPLPSCSLWSVRMTLDLVEATLLMLVFLEWELLPDCLDIWAPPLLLPYPLPLLFAAMPPAGDRPDMPPFFSLLRVRLDFDLPEASALLILEKPLFLNRSACCTGGGGAPIPRMACIVLKLSPTSRCCCRCGGSFTGSSPSTVSGPFSSPELMLALVLEVPVLGLISSPLPSSRGLRLVAVE
mmetsp:Transcript_31774/g.67703  ORF Transcript_31774/g.67703 Transcript_31774/m.67703 type:complete len:240 (-) Transcript_31774:385-1104(-)